MLNNKKRFQPVCLYSDTIKYLKLNFGDNIYIRNLKYENVTIICIYADRILYFKAELIKRKQNHMICQIDNFKNDTQNKQTLILPVLMGFLYDPKPFLNLFPYPPWHIGKPSKHSNSYSTIVFLVPFNSLLLSSLSDCHPFSLLSWYPFC